MNRIEMIGNITKAPEIATTSSGIEYCRFSLAVKGKKKNQDGEYETTFFNCVSWRERAKTLATYCDKGSKLFLSGEMTNRTYEKDGTSKTAWEVNVEDFEILTFKKQDNTDNELKEATGEDLEDLPF